MRRDARYGRAFAAAVLISASGVAAAGAQDVPPPDQVLATLRKVADWQLQSPSRHATTDWTKGALYAGMMALARLAPSPAYHDAMMAMGRHAEWKLGPRKYHADDHCVGQTYGELWMMHRDDRMIAALRAQFDDIMANPRDGNLNFKQKGATDRWSWCDSLFMAPPAWARLAALTGERKYLDFANRCWWVTSDYLYDNEEHLYFRDDTYFAKREQNGKKVFWSRGNGWVMGGLVRMLQFMPKDYPDRAKYEQQFTEMAAKVLSVQQDDGLWRSSLLDPAAYPLKETSGTGFFAYALAWGVNEGYLDRATYLPAVLKGWNGLVGCVRQNGKLAHVQPIGADPKKFDAELSEVYGVGAFLLAGSEIFRLGGGRIPSWDVKPAGAAGPDASIPVPAVVPAAAGTAAAAARDAPRAFGRHVPERKDDFAWENDRIAFRMYGPALEATGEISSGIDVWVKNVRKPVIDAWYRKNDYHKDHGEGGDFYKVGPTCGCGGTAVWQDGKLHFTKNWVTQSVTERGPERIGFELTYAPIEVGGRRITETKAIALATGSNLNRIENRYVCEPAGELTVAIGIVEHPGRGERAFSDKATGVLTYWDPSPGANGFIACAVVVKPSQIVDIIRAEGHHLVIVKVPPGAPLVYHAGGGWSKGGFPTPEAWESYVKDFARKAF